MKLNKILSQKFRIKNKKAQVITQVFVFILAAVIFGMIMIFGYKAINDFIQRSNEVAMLELRTEMVASINKMTTGSDVRKVTFKIPSQVQYVCFLDFDRPLSNLRGDKALCDSSNQDYYFPIICDSWVDNVQQNVFFYPMTDVEISAQSLEVVQPGFVNGEGKGFLCIKTKKERITLRLEGKGDRTLLEEWIED